MADNLQVDAGNNTSFADNTPLATKQLDDSSHAGVTTIVDKTGARAKMLVVNADGSINVAATLTGIADLGTEATLQDILTAVLAVGTAIGAQAELTDTQPVSAASLPLPTGASTAANQATGNASLSSIDSKLTTQAGYLDNVEALLTALGTYQDSLETEIGATNETAPASDTATAGLNGRLQRIAQRLSTIISSGLAVTNAGTFAVQVDVAQTEDAAHVSGDKGVMSLAVRKDTGAALAGTDGDYSPLQVDSSGNLRVAGSFSSSPASSELHLGEIGGNTAQVGVELTRPADTTAYAALDAVTSNSGSGVVSFTFTDIARVNSGSGYITKARLVTDQSANVAQFRLWLFNATPGTLQNDNAAYLIKYADKLTRLGYIDFPAMSTEAGSDCAQALADNIRLAFTADSSGDLVGILQTRTAFTPASGQKIYCVLTAERN